MSANKRKGDAWERAVVEVFAANGHPYAERLLRLGAREDRGDIAGVPGFHLDCKNCKQHTLGAWVDEVVAEAPAGIVPVVVIKRRNKPAARAYVVIELETFAHLIADSSERITP